MILVNLPVAIWRYLGAWFGGVGAGLWLAGACLTSKGGAAAVVAQPFAVAR
jgi:hypothetical protein